MTIKGIGRSAREVLLTFGALLGVLCIVATVAGVAFGVKPLVFRSGSMSPAIHTGDLAVSRTVDASALKTGDIVSVVNSEGNRVTHRLVNTAQQGDARQLTLKGDANKVADTEVYTVTKVERVLFDIPKAGYVVNAATSPIGVFALGAYVTAMLLLVFRRKGPDDDGPPGRRRQGGARRAGPKGARTTARTVATTAFAAALAVTAPASAAHWTNDVVIGGGTYTADQVPTPASFACTGSPLNGVNFTWSAVTGATNYTLFYASGTKNVLVTGATSKRITEVLTLTGTAWVVANQAFPQVTWTSAVSPSKSYTIALTLLGIC